MFNQALVYKASVFSCYWNNYLLKNIFPKKNRRKGWKKKLNEANEKFWNSMWHNKLLNKENFI